MLKPYNPQRQPSKWILLMTRAEFLRALVQAAPGVSTRDAENMLNALPSIVSEELKNKGEFVFHGLGRFILSSSPHDTVQFRKSKIFDEAAESRQVTFRTARFFDALMRL
jgi:nucleoid DNA-binding protein